MERHQRNLFLVSGKRCPAEQVFDSAAPLRRHVTDRAILPQDVGQDAVCHAIQILDSSQARLSPDSPQDVADIVTRARLRVLHDLDHVVRAPDRLDDVVYQPDDVLRVEDYIDINLALQRMTPLYRSVVESVFGIGGNMSKSIDQIAREQDVPLDFVRNALNIGLYELRTILGIWSGESKEA